MHNNGSWRARWVMAATAWALGVLIAPSAAAQTRERLLRQAEQAYEQKQYGAGSDFYQRVIEKGERGSNLYYDAACCAALAGRADQAFRLLDRAIDLGWEDAGHLASDPDLKPLHADARWAKLRDKLAAELAKADARRPFKTALGVDLGLERSFYVPFSEYRRLVLEAEAAPGQNGAALGSGKWYELKAKPNGWIYNKRNTVIQADWDEPEERTVLLRTGARKFITINGEEHYGGEGHQNVIPFKLKRGKNTIVCDHQFVVQLYPTEFPFSFVKDRLVYDSLIAPDIRSGESGDFDCSVIVANATAEPSRVTISARFGDGPETRTTSKVIPAMNSRITSFRFRIEKGQNPGEQPLRLSLAGGESMTVPLRVVGRNDVCQRTFVSRFDGMVRHYAVNPSSSEAADQAVVLAMPGGGWTAKRVANAYAQRAWCHFVCPQFYSTEGEGVDRQVALEVLEHAVKGLRADPKQVFLVGYSAGGHRAWQIAALNPGLFSGVGASAGWISHFSYSLRGRGMKEHWVEANETDTADPISKVFDRALSEIDVESRFDALASVRNIALVHGDADRSVKVSESRRMKQELEKRGAAPFYHEQPGADHAWATETADQVDCPPLLDHLRKHARRGTGDIWGGERLPRVWHDLLKRPLVAVYGTNGTPEENDAARHGALMQMDRCRVIHRRDCEVLPDTTPLAELRGKNVILYGSPSTNRLWAEHPTGKALLEAPSARKATSWLILGERNGDLWGAVGGQTLLDCRIAYTIDPMWSWFPFPDWVLLTRDILNNKNFQGILGAGWFGRDGKVDGERSAWR